MMRSVKDVFPTYFEIDNRIQNFYPHKHDAVSSRLIKLLNAVIRREKTELDVLSSWQVILILDSERPYLLYYSDKRFRGSRLRKQ